MNVIFLDHYGVMSTSNIETIREKSSFPSLDELKSTKILDSFNVKCVEFLNELSSKYDFEIVISSDWSRKVDFESMVNFYSDQKVEKIPIGYVELSSGDPQKTKPNDIRKFIDSNKIDNYIVVDDIFLEIDNFIWCDLPHLGLDDPKVKNSILDLIDKSFD